MNLIYFFIFYFKMLTNNKKYFTLSRNNKINNKNHLERNEMGLKFN